MANGRPRISRVTLRSSSITARRRPRNATAASAARAGRSGVTTQGKTRRPAGRWIPLGGQALSS
jgi:hypothetical protein